MKFLARRAGSDSYGIAYEVATAGEAACRYARDVFGVDIYHQIEVAGPDGPWVIFDVTAEVAYTATPRPPDGASPCPSGEAHAVASTTEDR